MKLSVKTTLIITILFIFASNISSQTIHRDDLKNLQFAFKIVKYENPPVLDYSKIINSNSYHKIYDSILYNHKDELIWFLLYSPDSLQNGVIQHHGIANNFDNKLYNKEFYAGGELSDNPSARNILTVWKRTTNDSLTFISASEGLGAGAYSASWVKLVSLFPDSSYFIYLKSRGADGGDVWDGYTFIRYTDSIVKIIHNEFVGWSAIHSYKTIKKISYNFDNLRFDNYQIFQFSKFYYNINEPILGSGSRWIKITDSILIEPIDIWELAKKHFNKVEQ